MASSDGKLGVFSAAKLVEQDPDHCLASLANGSPLNFWGLYIQEINSLNMFELFFSWSFG